MGWVRHLAGNGVEIHAGPSVHPCTLGIGRRRGNRPRPQAVDKNYAKRHVSHAGVLRPERRLTGAPAHFENTTKCRFLVNRLHPCHWLQTSRTPDVRARRGGRRQPNSADRRQDAPSGTPSNTSTSAIQQRATNRRNQKPVLQNNQERLD